MKVLDCESFYTTLFSLENITNINKDAILNFLHGFNIDNFYQRNPLYDTGDKILLYKFKKEFNPAMKYDQSNWFHLTRLHKNEDFKSGILPLIDVVGSKWDKLYNLISDEISEEEWIKFRRNMEMGLLGPHSSLYKFRVSNTHFKGPYAISIKDTAFKADKIRHHDYLQVPEIIKDICFCFKHNYGYDLFDEYSKNSLPCIVKFKTDYSHPDLIGKVLFYMYQTVHNKELNSNCKTNYNANGSKIPPEDILKVELLNHKFKLDNSVGLYEDLIN